MNGYLFAAGFWERLERWLNDPVPPPWEPSIPGQEPMPFQTFTEVLALVMIALKPVIVAAMGMTAVLVLYAAFRRIFLSGRRWKRERRPPAFVVSTKNPFGL